MTKLERNKTVSAEINYKKKKHYKTNKYPIRQPKYLTWLIWLLSKIMLKGKQHKVEKINMEGLKPPYILLSNHMAFIDFELVSVGTAVITAKIEQGGEKYIASYDIISTGNLNIFG